MYCNSLQVVNQDDYSIVVCSSGHRVLAMNTSTGEGLWEVQAGGNFSRFDTVGKVTFDKYTQFLFFQFAPLQFVNQGFIMAVDAWTGALAWNVSQGMNTTGGAASVNLVGVSEGVVVTVEGADWGTDWMVGRDSTNGALLWNVTSSMGGFGPFWIDTGVIYVIVNETWVEARSVEDGGVQWKWHTDWCRKHHDIGVACGLAAPYVWDGKLYLNFGFGEHDTCPFLALQIPSPTANRKASQMAQVAFD
jgi:outer membrane protein assembly factor BamB